ncbi:MAG: hypothetical protein JWR85_3567 [Marmoricola sp.]|nr:hypothetical protein [Marmoricola sp.]
MRLLLIFIALACLSVQCCGIRSDIAKCAPSPAAVQQGGVA